MKEQKTLSNQELISFCEHMSMILKAGLTPAAGIELMLDDTTSDAGREILLPISEKCNDGYSFPEALKAANVFPSYALNMIEIGNTSGNLEEVMDSLAYHYSREESLAQGIKSAVTYPFLIIMMMLVVMIVLVVKVLPIFEQVFIQLGTELTGFSKTLLNLGNTLSAYSILFISLFVVIAAGFIFFTKTTAGKKAFSKFCSKFFLTRSFFEKVSLARFASGMGITISAGLDFEKSLELVETLVDNEKMSEKIKKCKELMEGNGHDVPLSFSKAMVASEIFNNPQMEYTQKLISSIPRVDLN